jgi:hypothetical protein
MVARVTLVKQGSGYRGSVAVWLRGLRHPLALVLVPGGSVLVGDWGTGIVYRITGRG